MSRRRLRYGTIIIALAALAGLAALIFAQPRAVLVAYLTAAVTVSAIPAGALAVLMITYLVRGDWTEGLHVPLAAAALTMPIAGILFAPVLIGIPWLYPWANESWVHDSWVHDSWAHDSWAHDFVAHAARHAGFKAFYLTPWFFVLRTVCYFLLWSLLAVWVRGAWADPRRMVRAASAGLIIYALTSSFAGVDWLESLTPQFHSSIYGLLFLTFQLLTDYRSRLLSCSLRPARQRSITGPFS